MPLKTIAGYLLGILLSAWCVANIYDGLSVDNWYELVVGYAVVLFPFAASLLALSLYAFRRSGGWPKTISSLGLVIGAASFVLPLLQIAYVIAAAGD